MRSTILLGALCALAAHSTTAEAAPSWCKGGEDSPVYSLKTLFSETDAHDALRNLVAASCYPGDDVAAMTKQIAAARAAWSKKLGLVEADWAEVSDWAHLPTNLRAADRIEVKDRQAPWSAYSPLDQFGALSMADIGPVDAAYLADAFGAKLTQLGRLGFVGQCVASSATDPAVMYAMCAADVAALDFGKVAAEIRADPTHNATDRMIARLLAYDITTRKVPKYLVDTRALRAKDPAYETMFSLGQAAHAQWAKADPTLISLVSDLDDARVSGSRKASAGCATRAWDAWKATVAKLPAKRLADVQPTSGNDFAPQLIAILIAEPNGYLAALALGECATLEGNPDYLTTAISEGLERWPGFRGPRSGTQSAILTAGLKLDQRDASIEYPEIKHAWLGGGGGVGDSGVGALESVKIDGDSATLVSAKHKVTQPRCVRGHYSNRITRVTQEGQFIYDYVCDQSIIETIEVSAFPPKTVKARYATGLKAGMTVRIAEDVVVVAYPKGKGVPAIVTGVEVK